MNKRVLISLSICIALLGAGSFGAVSYAKYSNKNNFERGTTINGIDVGGQSTKDAYTTLKTQLSKNNIYLYQTKSSSTPNYTMKHMGLKYYMLNKPELNKMLKANRSKSSKKKFHLTKNQNFNKYVSYKLKNAAINADAVHGKEAKIVKGESQFEVTNEVHSTFIKVNDLIKAIQKNKVSNNKAKNTYYLSKYYHQFNKNYLGKDKLNSLANKANSRIDSITINKTNLSPEKTINKNTVSNFISITNNHVVINKANINKWTYVNFKKYEQIKSYGNHVKTPDGATIKFNKGEHGSQVNYSKLDNAIAKQMNTSNKSAITPSIQKINNKRKIDYVGVNLKTLREYVVRNGKVRVKTGVMSGKTGSNATPTGTFKIALKQSPSVLRGYNDDGTPYASPVTYWEPFNGAIGLHDSPWQPSFVYGNPQYRASYGSHGCINNPPSIMGRVYHNTYVGMTVVVY